jgi:predicted amidohydrolase
MERLRIASLQYFIRPVQTFDQFRDQVQALVETAADYKAQLLVFPEYFTVQLLTLGNVKRPIQEQIRDLALQADRFRTLMGDLARQHGLYIVAGTIPVVGDGPDRIYNECSFFSPTGTLGIQGKLHMTRFEKEEWKVLPREKFIVFETNFGRVAITICYDVEFPEIARAAGREGAHILVVPSCALLRTGTCRRESNVCRPVFDRGISSHGSGSKPELWSGVHFNAQRLFLFA